MAWRTSNRFTERLEEWEVVPMPASTKTWAQQPTKSPRSSSTDNASISKKKPFYKIIDTGLLIPGDGEPVSNATLVINGRLIAWVGSKADLPRKYSDAPHQRVSVPYLMPGLWDCHVHFFGVPGDATSNASFMTTHPTELGARLARKCWTALQRGYTSVRDLSGMGCEVSRAVEDNSIVGPNIYSAGGGLSQTGGHGDFHDLPAGMVLSNFGVSTVTPGHFGTGIMTIVDGKEECRRAVRLNIRRGARVIKVMASGGVGSLNDDLFCAQFSAEELECIVEEAARQNLSVSAHVHAKPGIMAAVKAGVATVEHASFADSEAIDLIKGKGVVYIATRTIHELMLATNGVGLPAEIWRKVLLVVGANIAAYKLAINAEVKIALGTDMEPGFNSAVELQYAVEAGMSTLAAIKAATANGPLTVGAKAPKTGQLRAGYEADVIGLSENPVEDVRVLQEMNNIKWVWKGGIAYKGPGVGPWGEDGGFQ